MSDQVNNNQQDLFEAAVNAAIESATITDDAVTPTATPEVAVEVAPEPAPAAVPDPVKTEPAAPVADRFAPRLLKLMEREAATVAKERALKEAEEKYSALEQRLKDLESAQTRFKQNPVDYLKKLAPDIKTADLAKALWYDELGDSAPPEHRAARAERVAASTVSELRAEWEAERKRMAEETQHREMERAHQQYVGALGSLAKAPPEQLPLVKAFSTEDPERVTRGLYRMAQKYARETNGEVATPEQCAQMLEKELNSIKRVFNPTTAAPEVKPAVPAATQAPSTLRNKHTSIQPTKTDIQSEEDRFQEAVRFAQEVRTRQSV